MLHKLFDHFSGRLYPFFWQYRHLWSKGWPEAYLSEESIHQSHRRRLCEALETLEPFHTILEYGCGPGANLVWFTRQFPFAKIYGVDISGPALECGRKAFEDNPNVTFLDRIPEDVPIDVFVTDACLIYRKEFSDILDAITLLSGVGYVGCEWHADCDESFTFGRHWVHNYRKLLPGCEVRKLTWDEPDQGWDTYGHIITWKK